MVGRSAAGNAQIGGVAGGGKGALMGGAMVPAGTASTDNNRDIDTLRKRSPLLEMAEGVRRNR
jgi:hypothetical protein